MGHREEKKRRIRAAIIENSIALFRERGFDATRVQDIARPLELSDATFFNYFSTKDAVLTEWVQGLLADAFAPAADARAEQVPRRLPPLSRKRRGRRRHPPLGRGSPAGAGICFQGREIPPPGAASLPPARPKLLNCSIRRTPSRKRRRPPSQGSSHFHLEINRCFSDNNETYLMLFPGHSRLPARAPHRIRPHKE